MTDKAFVDMNKLTFPLLCDYSRETVRKFNLFHNDYAGLKGYTVAKRSVFILDEQGVVRYKWTSKPGKSQLRRNQGCPEQTLKNRDA